MLTIVLTSEGGCEAYAGPSMPQCKAGGPQWLLPRMVMMTDKQTAQHLSAVPPGESFGSARDKAVQGNGIVVTGKCGSVCRGPAS